MATATVTSKGQITLPKEVRDHLGLEQGDRVDFVIEAGGGVRVRAMKRRASELFGFLKRPDAVPASLEDIDAAIAEGLAADDERIGKQPSGARQDRPRAPEF